MAGFQFIHLETYSRKPDKGGRTVDFVLAEASRRPDACTHVEAPKLPEVVHGVGLDEVRALHDARVAASASVDKNGKARKVRTDQHTLLTAVASHPGGSPEDVGRWECLTVDWLREQYGERLVSVVRHTDEAHPHLHAYVLPDAPTAKARDLHPGVSAKAAALSEAKAEGADAKTANAKGDRAYKQAMRDLQDSYWRQVGISCGLTRLGPGRRQLERPDWKAEQAQAERVAELMRAAEQAAAVVQVAAAERAGASKLRGEADEVARRAAEAVAEARAQVERAKAEADAVRASARAEAERLVSDAKRKAGGIVARAREQAGRLVEDARVSTRAIGARVGGVLLGLVGQAPSKVEARAKVQGAEAEREAAAVRESVLEAQVRELRDEVRGLRRDLAAALDTIKRVAEERDELRAVLDARVVTGPRMTRAFSP